MRTALSLALLVVGKFLLLAGLVLLGFVGYEVLGTAYLAGQSQSQLADRFEDSLRNAPERSPVPSGEGEESGVEPVPSEEPAAGPSAVALKAGEPMARVEIPAIDLDTIVVEGVGRSELTKGPGHYPGTPLPGQRGNVSFAGHRTTYGGPFSDLDRLEVGDEIVVTTADGEFLYRVSETLIVRPTDVEVIAPTEDARLTLTTCHPKFSAAQRLVVVASLIGTPVDAPPPPTAPSPAEGPTAAPSDVVVGAAGDPEARRPAALWGAGAMLVLGLGAVVSGRWPRPASRMGRFRVWLWVWVPTLLLAAAPILAFYVNLARSLPG